MLRPFPAYDAQSRRTHNTVQKIEYVFRPASMDGTNSPGESSPAERYKSVFLLPQ